MLSLRLEGMWPAKTSPFCRTCTSLKDWMAVLNAVIASVVTWLPVFVTFKNFASPFQLSFSC